MSRKKTIVSAAVIVLLGVVLFAVFQLSPLGDAPSEDELAAAIENQYKTAEITEVSISDQSYFCPVDCDTNYFRNQFSGEGVIGHESYRRLGPEQWVSRCGLSEDVLAFVPLFQGRDLVAQVSVYELQPTQGLEFTFEGQASTRELPDGTWDLGAQNIDFTFGDPEARATAFGSAWSEVDQIHFVMDSPEFDLLCELTEQSAEAGQVVEGDWPPLSLVDSA